MSWKFWNRKPEKHWYFVSYQASLKDGSAYNGMCEVCCTVPISKSWDEVQAVAEFIKTLTGPNCKEIILQNWIKMEKTGTK